MMSRAEWSQIHDWKMKIKCSLSLWAFSHLRLLTDELFSYNVCSATTREFVLDQAFYLVSPATHTLGRTQSHTHLLSISHSWSFLQAGDIRFKVPSSHTNTGLATRHTRLHLLHFIGGFFFCWLVAILTHTYDERAHTLLCLTAHKTGHRRWLCILCNEFRSPIHTQAHTEPMTWSCACLPWV